MLTWTFLLVLHISSATPLFMDIINFLYVKALPARVVATFLLEIHVQVAEACLLMLADAPIVDAARETISSFLPQLPAAEAFGCYTDKK